MPTMETVTTDALFAMFKGEPGVRKSTQALSFPGDQYWISTDRKMKALELPMKRWGIKANTIHYDDYSDWDKVRIKLEALQVNCPYKTIIVDSVTAMGDCITNQVKKYKKTGPAEKGKMIGGIQVSGLEEYNAEASAFGELMGLLQDIHEYHKINVILIAHVVGQRTNNDANKLTHHSRVIITGGDKISGKIASKMSEVYHFNVESDFDVDAGTGAYALFTSHTGNDYARTSLPLDRKIVFNNEPLYEKWIKPAIDKLKAEKPIQRITDGKLQSSVSGVQPRTGSFTP
jgi:hypothetical protein